MGIELFSMAGKTALITGGSGDIGRAIARAFASAGATVALNGTNRDKLAAAVAEIAARGGKALALKADISKVAACKRLAERAIASLGRVDVLVNCAGINRRKPILQVEEADFDAILDVHLRAAYFLSQALAPAMIANGGGKIIHIGSLTVRLGVSDVSVYGVAKAGMDQLTRVQAVEWAKHNIQVNCLSPGFIMTDLTRDGLFNNPERRDWVLSRTPMRRPGLPDELAGAALLFASNASNFITGQTLWVDGGVLAGSPWTSQ
jgi:NAD(P)-dependent dehydrogenase (short-subunit alcohol dehydrogenase family)